MTLRNDIEFSQQLMAQPTVSAQCELLQREAELLTNCDVLLWPGPIVQRVLNVETERASRSHFPTGLVQDVVRTRQLVRGADESKGYKQAVAIPLLAGDDLVAVLQAGCTNKANLDEAAVDRLATLSAQAALAIYAACQVVIREWRVDQLGLVRKVSAQVAGEARLEDLFYKVVKLVRETFDYYFVAIFTVESSADQILFRASSGPVTTAPNGGDRTTQINVRPGQGIVGWVAQNGREIVANDVNADPRYCSDESLPETKSEVALPLKIGERILGVLDIQSHEFHDFDESDLLVLHALADTTAIAIEDARLYSDLRQRAEQLSAVAEISRAVTSNLDTQSLYQDVVTSIHERFGYSFVHLFTIRPHLRQVVYQAGSGDRGRNLTDRELVYDLDAPQGIIPWVARNQVAYMANDVRNEPLYRPSPLPPHNTRSELAVPLVFGGEVMGVLDVQSDRPYAFTDEDRFLFEALADTTAVAVRNAHLYRSERWRRQVTDSLRQVAGLLSADVGLQHVLNTILNELENSLPCQAAGIWLLEGETLGLAAVHGCPDDESGANSAACASDPGSWLAQAIQAETPVIRERTSPAEPLGQTLNFPSDYSAITAPLRIGDQRLGLLVLVHQSPGRYGAESRVITTAFASSASVAIQNTRLFETAQRQAWISTVLLHVTDSIQSLTTLDQVVKTVVRLTPMLTGVGCCCLLLWNNAEKAFVPAASYGLSLQQREAFNAWRILPGQVEAFDRIHQDGTPIVIEDTVGASHLCGLDAAQAGLHSLVLFPLVSRGLVRGAILVDYCQHPAPGNSNQSPIDLLHGAGDETMAIMRGICFETAVALENMWLHEIHQAEAYETAALLQAAQTVTVFNKLDTVLKTLVRMIPILVGSDFCALFTWNDQDSVFTLAHSQGANGLLEKPDETTGRRFKPDDFPLLAEVRDCTFTGLCMIRDMIPNEQSIPGLLPHQPGSDLSEQLRKRWATLHAISLSVKDDVFGVLLIDSGAVLPQLQEKWLQIVSGIAHQAALAIQHDRLKGEMAGRRAMERELELAREIQEALMPHHMPELPDWELAATWQAARQVGGDFFDVFELPGNRLGLVMADVADKGVPAALFMALTRTLVRASALGGTSPAQALAHVNDLLVEDAQGGMFVTVIYAILSLDTGNIVFSNAGHLPPLVRQAIDGETTRSKKGGIALGVLEDISLPQHSLTLQPGDCFLLYTDGIIDALSAAGEMFGQDRLEQIMSAGQPGSAHSLLHGITRAVQEFVLDTPPVDDLTALVLRRKEA